MTNINVLIESIKDMSLRDYKVIALALDYALFQVDSSCIQVLNSDDRIVQMHELSCLLHKVRRELDMDNDKEFYYTFEELKEMLK
jgi:hypothetical protein